MSAEEDAARRRGVEQSTLEAAEATERNLREQLNDLVKARSRAESEALRLDERSHMPAADPTMSAVGERYRRQAERLAAEIEDLRGSLREQEAVTEAARADEAEV